MAEAAEIAQLRLLISEPDETTYTDVALSARIDAATSLSKAAADIWTEKAAAFAELVDISEGGSSRRNGDLYEQALSMSAHFRGLDSAVTAPIRTGTIVSRLRR